MGLIDADALKALSEAIDNVTAVEKYLRSIGETWYADIMSDTEEILNGFADDINVPNNGWISVKDRLPEMYKAVLGYAPYHNNIWAVTIHENGECYLWSWLRQIKRYDPDWEGPITHWMPLPEPPKGGKHE